MLEPNEVLRLFVLRPPTPTVLSADRVGRSDVLDKLVKTLEGGTDREFASTVTKLSEEAEKITPLLVTAAREVDPPKVRDLIRAVAVARETKTSDAVPEQVRVDKSITLPKTTSKAAAGSTVGAATKTTYDASVTSPQPAAIYPWDAQNLVERLAKLTAAELRWELAAVRDRLLLHGLQRSKLGRADAGHRTENPEDKNGPVLRLAVQIGTALTLQAEQPKASEKLIDSLLDQEVAPSRLLLKARQSARIGKSRAEWLGKRQDRLDSARTKRDSLRSVRRAALEVVDQLATAAPKPQPRAGGGLFARLLGFPASSVSADNGAAAPIQAAQLASEMDKRLNDSERKELRALTGRVATPLEAPQLLRLIEDEICAATLQVAQAQPQTGYVRRALRAAYSRPQVPVEPVGFIELMRVTNDLVGYSAKEIAHIENKAGGEVRERLHTFTETTQSIVTSEEFQETEETRDLQTSQRNELSSSASQVSEQEFTINTEVNVSATYGVGVGTSVQLDASLGVGYRSAVSSSQQTASVLAREIIAKSVSRVRQNQRRTQTATVLRTVEERNRHEFKVINNKTDTYLWVEKIEELKLKSYGKRLVLEVFVPEPGLPLALRYSDGSTLHEPEAFTITPADINEDNFGELKQRYGAVGIAAPPPEFLMVGLGHARKIDSTSKMNYYAFEDALKIPANYIPHRVFINAQTFGWARVYVAFAGRQVYARQLYFPAASSADGTHVLTPASDIAEVDQQGDGLSLSILLTGNTGYAMESFFYDATINTAVLCRRSCRAYRQWQLDTHDRLLSAYRARVAEYEEQRQANPVSATVGGPAAVNRANEIDALKRAALYILKGSPIFHDLYPSTDNTSTPPDQFDVAGLERLRQEINFFEEAFEWRQATYSLYPSFWGNEDRADARRRFHTADPRHAAFLEAGAARLLLPVLPGREKEVLEYLATQFGAAFSDLADNNAAPTAATIYGDLWNELPSDPTDSRATWSRSLTESRQDLTLGQGSVSVTRNSKTAQFNDAAAQLDPLLDAGREIWIEGRPFAISKLTDSTGMQFELDTPYSGPTNANANWVIGARTVGAPWRVSVPTSLVVLYEFRNTILP